MEIAARVMSAIFFSAILVQLRPHRKAAKAHNIALGGAEAHGIDPHAIFAGDARRLDRVIAGIGLRRR